MLPVKRIDGALLMRPEHLAGALRELRKLAQTSPGADGILHYPPEAFDGVEVMSAVGWQEMEAKRAVVVVEGRVRQFGSASRHGCSSLDHAGPLKIGTAARICRR